MRRVLWIPAALLVLYLLSYAPALRYRDFVSWPRQSQLYRPVEWLIDNTPARRPLMWWVGLWGVEEVADFESLIRQLRRSIEEHQIEMQSNPPDPDVMVL